MFMPQHPVYMKLGINKYCIKNQHLGLNALIHLFCIFDVIFFPPIRFFPQMIFFPPNTVQCLHKSWKQLEKCNSHTFLSDRSVSELIKKELLKSPLAFIYLFCIVLLSRAVTIVQFPTLIFLFLPLNFILFLICFLRKLFHIIIKIQYLHLNVLHRPIVRKNDYAGIYAVIVISPASKTFNLCLIFHCKCWDLYKINIL